MRFQFADDYAIHVEVFTATGCDRALRETDEAVPLWFSTGELPYERMWPDDIMWVPLI